MRKWTSSKPFRVIIVYSHNVQVQSITGLWPGRSKVCIFPTYFIKKIEFWVLMLQAYLHPNQSISAFSLYLELLAMF